MITPDTLMEDLKDRGEMPAEAPYDCVIEIDKEERQAIIVWTELLQFHAEHNETEWKWLTYEQEDYLAKRLAELIQKQAGKTVQVHSGSSGDEPNVSFEVVTDYRDGETYQQWLDRVGWPVVATLINVTDPGTFMSAYLFDLP